MEVLVLLALLVRVHVGVCVSIPLPPSEQNIPFASCSHLTSGNNVRSHLIFTFERRPYNQM